MDEKQILRLKKIDRVRLVEEIPKEARKLANLYGDENDRTCAILTGIFLDEMLTNLLRQNMLKDISKKILEEIFENQGLFSNFSAKIRGAYVFGLISKIDYLDLNIIRKIRNQFAHAVDYDLHFESPKINELMESLNYPKELKKPFWEKLESEVRPYMTNNRAVFTLANVFLIASIKIGLEVAENAIPHYSPSDLSELS